MTSWNVVLNPFQSRLCQQDHWSQFYTSLYTVTAIFGAMTTSLTSGFYIN